MWFREGLRAKNRDLTDQLDAITASPEYQIAQGITADVERITTSPDYLGNEAVRTALAEAIQKRRGRQVALRTAELINEKVEIGLNAAKAEIETAANQDAARIAAETVDRFVTEEGPNYWAQVHQLKVERKSAAGIADAKYQMLLEARLVDTEDRELLKQRAKEIRGLTDDTHSLPLGWLRAGDIVTLGFTHTGGAAENLTEPFGWDTRRYRQDLEVRNIKLRLIDPAQGFAYVEKDSWSDDEDGIFDSLQTGDQAFIRSFDPQTEDKAPVLIKGAAAILEDDGGKIQGATDNHHLWWVNLGDFRALS